MRTIVWFVFVLCALSASGKVFVAKQGQKTMLECGVSTYSDTLEWNRENDLLCSTPKVQRKYSFPRTGKSDTALRSKIRPETRLEIAGVTMQDAGKFTCKADGKSYQHTLLVVLVSASSSGDLLLGSEVTLKCQVTGMNPDSTVQWKRPDGRSHAGSQAELKSVARSDAGTWNCMFSYDGTTYSESLEIKVQEPKTTAPPPTQKSKDNGKPSCLDCVTHPKPNDALLLGLSWWMWVAIGVGCLLVLLLIVLIVVLRERNKRRKRKFRSMKNGGLPMRPKNYCQCNRPAAAAKPQQGRRREKPSAPPLQPLLME
ncbi:limbic system-associated membrane protein isoform X1 [Epinephelus lanceolatus]|uniref:CD4-2 molecule, tandem duplicate 2 isoform X1 n=1 Tax=Epinephelus lanceolatus TaxID=310571 RepID=UPI001446BD25|nr:CD4-2 molecule, tandem duplicate 2 isoform X1 [Epinephelus lanceolatus]XP_033497387.1 CD4-2 molecule, tandem duplicate 2 isoform X1 [Epinephelus lanceolatus]